jgi:hypothetical protein
MALAGEQGILPADSDFKPDGETMQSKAVFLLSTACVFASAAAAGAQVGYNPPQIPSRFVVGGDLAISQPKGEFASNVPTGYGFDLNGLFKLDPKGWFGIRADAGGVRYGHEHIPLGFFSGIELDLNTDNRIEFGALGLQLQIPDGWFRPYANASYAGVHFTTESCVSNPDGLVQDQCHSNHGDWAGAGVFGGGVKIPFGTFGALNFGARYHYGAKATYLRKGDIVDNPDGSVTLNVRSSKTDLVLWQIGFSYNIPQ